MKSNFLKSNDESTHDHNNIETNSNQKNLTQKEFEVFMSKSGAKSSFMIYRSTKKDEELGLDEL
ncbi:MAG: hypothetical protein WD717_03090 [Nitrosarchaeum sp.]